MTEQAGSCDFKRYSRAVASQKRLVTQTHDRYYPSASEAMIELNPVVYLASAIHEEEGEKKKLHLLMVNHIPAEQAVLKIKYKMSKM